jgi:hypothetical protein
MLVADRALRRLQFSIRMRRYFLHCGFSIILHVKFMVNQTSTVGIKYVDPM